MRSLHGWKYVDPKHEEKELILQITGTLRATEAWTDGRHAADDKYVELGCELALTLANVTEGAATFKVVDEAQKKFVVREMMPNDIKR